jgi:orotate phosphoribosyltransferase
MLSLARVTVEANLTYTNEDLLRIIHETKAVSIWNRKTGPIFWYAASIPGPFYVNSELVIGKELSAALLKKITDILAATADSAERAKTLNTEIIEAYEKDENYRKVVRAMAETANKNFSTNSYDMVSGGERRDWLFSIPLAKELDKKHVFLFKNLSSFCEQGINSGEKSLHAADLINNAASYFDLWLPALDNVGVKCVGTVCINIRGTAGVKRLEESGHKAVSLNNIDVPFFEKSCAEGLIDEGTLEEIRAFFRSSKEWAEKYLMGNASLFNAKGTDAKSLERMKNFFANDPWGLREKNAAFFSQMLAEAETAIKK